MKGFKKGKRKVSLQVFTVPLLSDVDQRRIKGLLLQSKSKHQEGKDPAGAAGNEHLSEAAKVSTNIQKMKSCTEVTVCSLLLEKFESREFLFFTFSTVAAQLVPLFPCLCASQL